MKEEKEILGSIPRKLLFIGIVVCIISIVAIVVSVMVLFNKN
jgi:hypothetical protein